MKGNRNTGMGLKTAAANLRSWWQDLKSVYPSGLSGSYWDVELDRILAQMRKRARLEEAGKC